MDDRGGGKYEGVCIVVERDEGGYGDGGFEACVPGVKGARAARRVGLVGVFGDEGAVEHDDKGVVLHAEGGTLV